MKFRSWRVVAGLALAASATLTVVFLFMQRNQVSPSEALPAMHTVCVGRMLIDLPVDIEPDGDVELYYGLGTDFKTAKFEPVQLVAKNSDFDATVARRIAKLTQSYQEKTPTQNQLASSRKIDDRTVLILAHEEPVMKGYFLAEILFMRGESIGRITREVFDHDRPEDIEAKLIELVGHITPLDDLNRAGKGTCLGGMLIDHGQDAEVFTIGMRSTRFPDVSMGIHMSSVIAKGDGGLLDRVDGKAGMLSALGATGTQLRRGKITMAGRPAEELISAVKDNGKVVRQFDAETLLLKASTFVEPQIHIDITMGGQVPGGEYVDPSFSEKASLTLWDSIIRSIRLRPGAV